MNTMGHVIQKATLSAVNSEDVSLLVDTGATYSLISPKLAERLGVVRFPRKTVTTLANGTRVEADIGVVQIQIGDRSVGTLALIMDCDEPLLGVETLEALGMGVDPSSGSLMPTRKYTLRLGGLR
jgi:clan AA aspartic protease